jgi:hypothetical protein
MEDKPSTDATASTLDAEADRTAIEDTKVVDEAVVVGMGAVEETTIADKVDETAVAGTDAAKDKATVVAKAEVKEKKKTRSASM